MAEDKGQQIDSRHQELSEVLNEMDPKKRDVVLGAIVSLERRYQSPFPSPDDMKAYKEIDPNAPETILRMAEESLKFQMETQKNVIDRDFKENRRGQLFGFASVILCLGVATLLGINGHDWLAAGIVAIIASVATIFVLHKEPAEKPSKENRNG